MSMEENRQQATGRVYLVGAGPGDPELMTVRAARLLESADVVLHDDLVPAPILKMAGPRALTVSVGKRCGRKKTTQAAIHGLMTEWARKGMTVVRLKCGDPGIFGRAGEEMDALRTAGVPFEVVPGVTAASAAAASAQISLTDRRAASSVLFLSGHHAGRNGDGLPRRISAPLPEDATLAIYMPGPDYGALAHSLMEAGLAADTPCILVSGASHARSSRRACRLDALEGFSHRGSPALLLAGRALEAALVRDAPELDVDAQAIIGQAAVPRPLE